MNLIELLTANRTGLNRDPAERRLTAGLAAVLEHVPGLAPHLLSQWLPGVRKHDLARVTVERPIGKGVGWIDLEMSVGGGSAARRLWLEAKLRSPLSGSDQLDRYRNALAATHSAGTRLVLVAPMQRYRELGPLTPLGLATEEHAGPYFLAWEELYGALVDWQRDNSDRDRSWLVSELLDYMKKVEHLDNPGPVTAESIATLRNAAAAEASLAQVLLAAGEDVDRDWNRRTSERRLDRDQAALYLPYRRGPRSSGWGSSTRFAWGVDELDDGDGTFWAGLYFATTSGRMASKKGQLWLAAREAEGWELDVYQREGWLFRRLPLEALLKRKRADAQAKVLGAFVLQMFEALERIGPPR